MFKGTSNHFHITVTANWFENGSWQSRSAETWRYNLMYQP